MHITSRLVSILLIAMLAVACSPSGEVTDSRPPTVRLVTSDGLDVTMVVSGCESPGETTLKFVARTEDDENPIVLSLDATGGQGTIVLSGGDEREGTVDQLMVGDRGEITASGTLNIADDSASGTSTFELTGDCA
jgi:hypothetical protein